VRLRILHKTIYSYDQPATSVIELLRLTPRNHEGQQVRNWRIELDQDAQLRSGEDAFGNIFHVLTLPRALEDLVITVQGEVDTQNTDGMVNGTLEVFPPGLFLRETSLTEPNPAIVAFGRDAMGDAAPLEALHKLLAAVNREMTFDTRPTNVTTSAAQAFEMKNGVCQDLAHVFIAATRSRGIPARYIGGHMFRADGMVQQEAGHAWAEAHVDGLGWVGFDPANGISVTEAHVRVSVGLDYLGAAPVRGARYGGTEERLQVSVAVEQAGSQRQS
jgi:transglutaminase-like putative cysteine protease